MKLQQLLLAILILGCIQAKTGVDPIQGMTSDGITVLKTYFTQEQVESGNEVDLLLQIQNTGASTADEVIAEIIRKGRLTCKCVGKTCMEGKDATCGQKIDSMAPPDLRIELDGEVQELFWTLTPEGITTPVDSELQIRLGYDYKSEATQEIPVFTNDRLSEIQMAGNEPAPGVSTQTEAPVEISIKAPENVVVKVGIEKASNFVVELENIGPGVIRAKDPGTEDERKALEESWCGNETLNCLDSLELKLEGGGPTDLIRCEDYSGKLVPTDEYTKTSVTLNNIKLWQGGSARINCQLNTTLDGPEAAPSIRAVAQYRYSVDTPVSIKLLPSRV